MREKFLGLLKSKNKLVEFHNIIQSGNFNEIYNLYGSSVYQLFTPYDYQQKEIKYLLETNDFDSLRQKYGNLYHAKVSAFNTIEKLKEKASNLKLDKKLSMKLSAVGLSSLMMLSTACSNQNQQVNNDEVYSTTVTAATTVEKDTIEEKIEEPTVTKKETAVEVTTPNVVETEVSITEPEETIVEAPVETEAETTIETTVETTEPSVETTVETTEPSVETTVETPAPVLRDASRITSDSDMSDNEITNYNVLLDAKDYLEKNDNIQNIIDLRNANTLDPNTVIYYDMPFIAGISLYNQDVANENLQRYQNYVDEYNKSVDAYVEYIKSLNLNDLETIAKVMDDIWYSVEDGFCNDPNTHPGYDIYGMFGYDIVTDNSAVKCRNLADIFTDITKRLGYESTNLIVNTDSSAYSSSSFADIDVRFSNNTDNLAPEKCLDPSFITTPSVNDDNGKQASYQIYMLDAEYGLNGRNCLVNVRGENPDNHEFIGDHMVTMMAIKDKDSGELLYNLVVDTTNANVSVVKDGKIYCLSNVSYDGTKYEGLEISACGNVMHHTFDDSIAICDAFIDSRARTEYIDVETVNQLYGVEALNRTLSELRSQYGNYNIGGNTR